MGTGAAKTLQAGERRADLSSVHTRDAGFTLTELAVVAAIIAALIAVAAGVFMGARERAQDVAAQATLREAIIAGAVVLDANESTVPPLAAALSELAAAEPDISWRDPDDHATSGEASVAADPAFLLFASGSPTGECHYIKLTVGGTIAKHRALTNTCTATDGLSIGAWLGW